MKVLFLGSPYFSVKILEKLLQSSHKVVAVVTQPDRPSGRGQKVSPTNAKIFAIEHNIPVYAFEKVSAHIEDISQIDYDIAVTASFGQILNEKFLSIKPCINVHPSLLPLYRGATPIQSALLNNDKETGVSIMKVVKEVDAGDIYSQKEIDINDDDNFSSLQERLAQLGGAMLIDVLNKIETGKIKAYPQNNNNATFCTKITKEEAFIDFNLSADILVGKSRALNEIGCFIFVDGQRLKIDGLKNVSNEFQNAQCGEIINVKGRIIFGCKDGAVEILKCQSKTGKMVSARDFLNGFSFKGKKIN